MPPETSTTLPRKKRSILWGLAGVLLLFFGLFLFQLIGPDPRIIISKQTTYISAPLLPSGEPNYEEYMRQKLREGVTPENNAAVLLLQAFGPGELEPAQYKDVARELGRTELPSAEAAMQAVFSDANRKRILDWLPEPGPDELEHDVESIVRSALSHLWTLDTIVHSSIYGFDAISDDAAPGENRSPTDYASIDWNIVLQKLNHAYDEGAAAMRIPAGAKRRQAFDRFDAKLDAESNLPEQPRRLVGAFISRRIRSELIGSIYAALMLPAMDAASAAEDRTNSILTLAQLSAALAVYRTEHGDYPNKLDKLVPAILGKLPVDLYHAKPFIYKRLDKGYLLYTSGLNGRDDVGSNEQMSVFNGRPLDGLEQNEREALQSKIPADSDDFSIRLPVPRYKPPNPQEH